MKRAKRKSSFTLVEILVSLSILALVSTLVGFKVVDLLKSHRFKASIEGLYGHIKELQALSLCHAADFEITLYSKQGRFFYICSNDADIKKGALFSSSFPLLEVNALQFNHEDVSSITFLISSSGRIYPKGPLILRSDKGSPSRSGFLINTQEPFLLSLQYLEN